MSAILIQNVSAVQSALRSFSVKRALNTDSSYQTTICFHLMYIWLSFLFAKKREKVKAIKEHIKRRLNARCFSTGLRGRVTEDKFILEEEDEYAKNNDRKAYSCHAPGVCDAPFGYYSDRRLRNAKSRINTQCH